MAEHKSIATALAAAQMEMEGVLKNATNQHFKKRYADLAATVDAAMPPLNKHGIAVIQPIGQDETGRFVKTVLIHGASGETLECSVPLIVNKNDMQGFGSAVTYARRYGLLAMAGIAPEDDDGNDAAKAAPKEVSPEQFIRLRDAIEGAGVDLSKFLLAYSAQSLEQFPADRFDHAMKALAKKAAQKEEHNDQA